MAQQATPIVKNKFWILEEDGKKIGTIQAAPDGVILVQGQRREKFPTFKMLSSKYNITTTKPTKPNKTVINNVYDYPCDCVPHNSIYDLKLKLPLYTKEEKSKSYHCAGYYLVKDAREWTVMFCPKKIILIRQEYIGPFVSPEQINAKLS
jgi:hypothetical protein